MEYWFVGSGFPDICYIEILGQISEQFSLTFQDSNKKGRECKEIESGCGSIQQTNFFFPLKSQILRNPYSESALFYFIQPARK